MKRIVLMAALALGLPALTAPAPAVPSSMQIRAQTTVINGPDKVVLQSLTQMKQGKVRMETQGKGPDGKPINSVMLIDPKTKMLFMLNAKTRTAMKMRTDDAATQFGLGQSPVISAPEEIETEFKRRGGVKKGTATINGRLCDIWEVPYKSPSGEATTMKVWLVRDLKVPAKAEAFSKTRGKIMELTVTDIKTGVSLADSLFVVPSGYKVTDLNQVMKQTQGK